MQKLGSSMDFGQEAILGLAGDGLPDLSSALPEAAASLPQVPSASASAKPAKAAGVKSASSNDLMPPPALKAIYDRVAAEERVPVNVLVAMGHTESRHRADIDGPQTKYGAAGGIMQYLPGMAAAHKINRYNPEESIRQAAIDLRERLAKNKGDMANAVARHHAGDNPQQLGPKSREYAETILAKARRLAPVYEAEQAAMIKDASKLREASREQAAEAKRGEYYPPGGTRPAGSAKPAAGTLPSLAGNGLFGFGEQLQQARQAAPYGNLGVMNGFNAGSTPAAQERSTTPVTPEAEAEVRAALTVLPAGQREALLQDKGWRGQVARTIWAKSEGAKKLQHATGIGPKVGAPDPIITRDEIEASYQKSGYTPDQAAQLAMHDLAGHTDQVRASDFDFEGMQAARDSLLVQAGRDVKRGASNLRAMSEGLAGTVYGLMGADDAARSALEVATARMERTGRENPALIGSYENIHGADDAIRYAVEAVAENLPMFVPSLASGGAGGLAARKAAQGIVSDMVAKVGRERALKELERRIMIGQVTGAATASVGMETGSIADDIYQKTGRAEPWTALAGGIPAGLLDTIEPVMALRKIAGPVADGVAGSIIKRLGVESGKQFMAEAGTEGLQTIIENAAVLSAQNKQPLTPELLDGVVDAMLKGGIGGGVMGAGSEAVSGLRHDRRQPALDYGAATKAAFGDPLSPQQAAGNAPSGPIGRAVSKAQAAPVAPTFAADDDLDRPPVDESMYHDPVGDPLFEDEQQAHATGAALSGEEVQAPTVPTWGHQPAAELAGQPVEVGRKENFAADYPVPPAPDANAIADVDARVAGAREQASAAQRRQILDRVLSDSAVRNPVAKFAAELARAGYAQAMPSPAELATIERFSSAKDAFTSAGTDASLQEPAAPNEMGNDEAADWRAQRDAEIMPGADASSTPSSNAGMQKNAGEAQLSTTLPASLKSLADATEKPGPFIKKLRKAGYTIRDADHERQLINQFKEYKANGTAATDTNTGNALAQAQPAGDTGRAERPAADAQPGRNADGSVDAGRRQRNDQAVAADGGAGKQPASVKQGKNWHAKAKEVDLSRDTVRDAVARLGGIRKDEAMREWGTTLVEGTKSRIFGKPVFRAKGGTGMSLDKMREALAELGYLPADSDINDLYEAFEQDSLHHVGQERRAADMTQGAATEGQSVPAGEAAAMPERTLDNHPVYDPWYDFDPGAILPDDLNEAAASAGEIVGDEDAEMFEAITTRLHQVLGADEAEAITERAAIMADSGKNFFEAVLELINGRQEAESNTGAAEPAAEGGKAAEASAGQAGARAAADIQQGQPDAGLSADEAGQPGGGDAGILQSYDQAELDAREQAQRAAESRRQGEERAADRKRQADAEVNDFVLTGSDTMADQLAARGQGGLFDEAGAPLDTADDARQSRLSNEPTASAASRIPAANGQGDDSTLKSEDRASGVLPDGARLSVAEADALNLGGEKASTDLAFHFRTETGKPFTGGLKVNAVQAVVSDVTGGWKNLPAIEAVQGFDELPAEIQQECRRQGGNEYSVQGILSRKSNKVYVIAGNHEWARDVEATLFHEIIGHYGLGILTSDDAGEVQAEHLRLFKMVGGRGKLMEMAARFGVAKDIESYRKNLEKSNWSQATQAAILFDELIAHIAEKQPSGWKHALRLAHGYLRSFLRQAGFKRLATLNDADVSVLVNEAARAVRSSAKNAGKRASKMSIANAEAGLPLSIDDLHDVFRQSPLGSWVDKLIASGRLTIKPNLVLPEGYKHLEATQAFTAAGKITMFAGNIGGRQRVMPVLLHEVFHSSGEALLGGKEWGKLIAELDQLRQHAESNPAGKAGKLWGDAKRRVQQAIDNGDNMTRADMAEELGAYAIELADQAPLTWQRWVDRLLGHVKAWARRVFGVQLGRLTPEQLRALAIAALRDGATTASPGPRLSMQDKETISMKEGNFPGAESDTKEAAVAAGREAQRMAAESPVSARQILKDMGLKYFPHGMKMMHGDAIIDIYKKDLPALQTLARMMERQSGDRQLMQKEAGETFKKWASLPAAVSDRLADLMHEATIWQLHPDKEAPPNLTKQWQKKHVRLAADWAALPDDAKAVYQAVRDLNEKRTEQMFSALENRIKRVKALSESQRAGMLQELRARFDKTMGEGPYFPLSRDGDYLVVAKKHDDTGKEIERIVLSSETLAEQESTASDLKQRGFDDVRTTSRSSVRTQGSSGSDLTQFAAHMIGMLDDIDMSPEQRTAMLDDINQMLIDALPPASARKHFKHRKGVPGFSNDARRAFAKSQNSMANHIANINFQDQIDAALDEAQEQADAHKNSNELARVVGHMRERQQAARAFVASRLANSLAAFGYVSFLAFSASNAILNLSQIPMFTGPMLASKFGDVATASAMTAATGRVLRAAGKQASVWAQGKGRTGDALGDVRVLDDLPDDDIRILKAMEKRGKLDLTYSMEMVRAGGEVQTHAGNPKTSLGKMSEPIARARRWYVDNMGILAHVTEAANRQITAIAAYRLAIDAGMSHSEAVDYTAEVLDSTQINYEMFNRPLWMMNNYGRVISMMLTFSIRTMGLLMRKSIQSFDGGAEGREARGMMARMLLSVVFFAGASGLPILPMAAAAGFAGARKLTGSRVLGAAGGAASMLTVNALLSGLLGDEDEPWDWDTWRRQQLNDLLGKDLALAADKGVIRSVLKANISDRIGMASLLYRDIDTGSGNGAAVRFMERGFIQFGGGAWLAAARDQARAYDLFAQGQTLLAVEAAAPKHAADVIKATRLAMEGVTVPVGGQRFKVGEVSGWEVAVQALGFNPDTLARRFEQRNAARKAVADLQSRRGELLASWVAAKQAKDDTERKMVEAEIDAFNKNQRAAGRSKLVITPRDRNAKLNAGARAIDRAISDEYGSGRYEQAADQAAEVFGK